MKEFNQIYKLLKILKCRIECEDFDEIRISPEALGMSETRRNSLLEMLQDKGYIKGLKIEQFIGDSSPTITGFENLKITLDGLQYLEENSMMHKAADFAKGIKEII